MFIVGGLIAVAILAIIGAFLLARGGGATREAKKAAPAAPVQVQEAIQQQPDVPAEEGVHTRPLVSESTVQTPVAIADAPTAAIPVQVSQPLAAMPSLDHFEQEIHMLQDNVYQLTEQLQILNHHSREIEQRLGRIYASLSQREHSAPVPKEERTY
ncbi:hypothetical protein KSC_066530 [Ktedonobacter sp. SOSP1-52]|uniref:hypothetical protein n=1 Tax=Ktedonobacter sp. SOSP1-52 TaxID=2778366 RepID=UPI0019168DEF|nr:hypothetical protein [Ktedonobacter sp. SOSP1-52]GHO67761.1 hypothetical protein KSC_066530 [Ktedonobacter sp. SOSP1-52]